MPHESDNGKPHIEQIAERRDPRRIGEHRRNGDDRHYRLGADQRNQNERRQWSGAIAGNSAQHADTAVTATISAISNSEI